MDGDLALRAEILAIITQRTVLGERITIRALQERLSGSPKHHVRLVAENLSKEGLIQSRKGGYAATPAVEKVSGTPIRGTGSAFEIPLHRLMAGR